jgi:hypothetical protein
VASNSIYETINGISFFAHALRRYEAPPLGSILRIACRPRNLRVFTSLSTARPAVHAVADTQIINRTPRSHDIGFKAEDVSKVDAIFVSHAHYGSAWTSRRDQPRKD